MFPVPPWLLRAGPQEARGERRVRERIVLRRKDGSSTLEASKRHVGVRSVCMFGVAGAYRPFPGKVASRRGCLLSRKGKV